MKRAIIVSVIVFALTLFAGCIIIDDSLDYRHDLSDYKVKKIVRKVLLSQNSINRAGVVTSDGLDQIITNRSRYLHDRVACNGGGYVTFTLSDGTVSLTLSAGDLLHIEYDDCSYTPLYYDQSRLDGSIDIQYNQNIEDYRTKLLDFTINYYDTYLYSHYGTLRIDGEVGVHYNEDYTLHELKLIFSSNRLVIDNRDRYDEDLFTNIVLNYTIETDTTAYAYEYSGTLDNDYFGRLTFTTRETMEGYGNKNPQRGRFEISNAHMTLTVIPINDYYVDIDVDNHYYASRNRTIHTTWINIGL